jgi:hypothetical protein
MPCASSSANLYLLFSSLNNLKDYDKINFSYQQLGPWENLSLSLSPYISLSFSIKFHPYPSLPCCCLYFNPSLPKETFKKATGLSFFT